MRYLANAFSLGMLSVPRATISVEEINLDQVKSLLSESFTSAVGHQSTAEVLTLLLGVEVPHNRVELKLEPGDTLLVFQLLTRLPEGRVLTREEVLSLPFKFYLVEVK